MIELRDITKCYEKKEVLSHIWSKIGREILTVLGPTGSGKTTLLRLIAGLEKPDRGEILFDGKVVSNEKFVVTPYKRGVNMVFQDLALWPHMNISEHLKFALTEREETEEKAEKILLEFDLIKEKDRFPHQLSGGEQQKLALARALITEPRILLLDEPFANLDISSRRKIKNLLRDICAKREITLIYVTHDLLDALEIGERIIILNQGKIEEDFKKEDFVKSSNSEFIKLLLENIRGIDASTT